MAKLRIAIVGCNKMGKKHLSILQQYYGDKVEIAGIINSTPESSARKAAELNVPYFENYDEITKDNVDGVIVSTPGTSHCEVGKIILSKGIPCLMEKPMAMNAEECDEMSAAARQSKTFMLVGHTENFNPAVIKLKEVLDAPVKSIEGIRVSANPRVNDISVIPELMIHDLAIVNALVDSPLKKAKVTKKPEYRWDEQALVEMDFANGAHVKLEGIIANVPVERWMKLEDIKGNHYEIQFLERSLFKNGEKLCEGGDSLQNELGHFIDCLNKKTNPQVTAEEGKRNVITCNQLERQIPSLNPILQRNIFDKKTYKK